MARVVLIAGGNIGDVKSRLQEAQKMINDSVGAVMRCSHRYRSEAWGFSISKKLGYQYSSHC